VLPGWAVALGPVPNNRLPGGRQVLMVVDRRKDLDLGRQHPNFLSLPYSQHQDKMYHRPTEHSGRITEPAENSEAFPQAKGKSTEMQIALAFCV